MVVPSETAHATVLVVDCNPLNLRLYPTFACPVRSAVVSPTLNCVAYETGNSQSLFVLVKILRSALVKNHISPL